LRAGAAREFDPSSRESAPVSGLRQVKRFLSRQPLLRWWIEQRYERYFSTNGFAARRGVFQTFAEAYRSAPATKPKGFDSAEMVETFRDRVGLVCSHDYPVLFWLEKLLFDGCLLLDVGGHIGVHFYAFESRIKYPSGFRWVVAEVPTVAKAGEQLGRERGRNELKFVTDYRDVDEVDIFFSSGALQYVEAPQLHEWLASRRRKPLHLLLNKLPLYSGEAYVTLQNSGAGFTPHYVFNRAEFLTSLEKLGYTLVDSWENPARVVTIPFHPEHSFESTSGLYLRRAT
jgi:putative methyltransferase (TIGR04325 family)